MPEEFARQIFTNVHRRNVRLCKRAEKVIKRSAHRFGLQTAPPDSANQIVRVQLEFTVFENLHSELQQQVRCQVKSQEHVMPAQPRFFSRPF